jgi:hypothetical protein
LKHYCRLSKNVTFQKKFINNSKPVFKIYLKKNPLSLQGFFKKKVFFLINKSKQMQIPMREIVSQKYLETSLTQGITRDPHALQVSTVWSRNSLKEATTTRWSNSYKTTVSSPSTWTPMVRPCFLMSSKKTTRICSERSWKRWRSTPTFLIRKCGLHWVFLWILEIAQLLRFF